MGIAVLLSKLYEQLNGAPEVRKYAVFLASPVENEEKNIDAYAVGIRDVDVDRKKNEIKLIPASGTEPSASSPILVLSDLIERLPMDAVLWGDFTILVELPLDRDSRGVSRKSVTKVLSLHIGTDSEEAWFLIRPATEYTNNVLPA